ncbi:MAG: hypothetical protein M3P38_10175 [Chloroflexota bacterium]|nr:hypothetical protein [Chloroflexota bacterium]
MAQEHSVFTWDPVGARWIHERGPEMTSPPMPPDIHAIQTYFFDPEEKEWIATVLAPWGRQLAAQWQGAYKIPDQGAPPKTTGKKSSPAPLFAIVLVLLIVGGGAAAVVAGTQSTPNASPALPTNAPAVTTNPNPTAPVALSAEPTATAPVNETPAPTQRPGGTPAPTQPPVRTPVPTVAPPVGTSLTLADGSVVTYSGPARVNIGVPFTVTFTVRNANNTPGTGTLLVSFGNASTSGSKTSSGTLNGSGQLVMNYAGASLPGNYPFTINYKGQQGQVAILRVG